MTEQAGTPRQLESAGHPHRELLDPGCVLVSRWRPDGGVPGHNADRAWSYCGIALI